MAGKFFKCECGGEGLWIEHTGYNNETEIALFSRDPADRSWCNRFRLAWACLSNRLYTDMVILNDQAIADLVDFLVEIQNKDNTIE